MVKKGLFKKFTTWMLISVMAVSTFTGCGAKTDTSTGMTNNYITQGDTGYSYTTNSGTSNKNEYIVYDEAVCSDEASYSNGMDVAPTVLGGDEYSEITPDTREYDYEDENRFFTAKLTPYSTFAADVDTASYSNIRTYIKDGSVVPISAVRIEEMVNYFNYDYANPKGDEPFSVNMEIGDCPWNDEHKLIQIGLKTEEIDMTESKNNFVFLIDTSGSMGYANKLPLVQTAFTQLVYNLGENDTISIVTYAGSDTVLLSGVNGEETDVITNALDGLMAGGSTNGSAGIETAYKLAEKYFIEDGNNRVILATDGDLNVGVTDEGALVKLIKEKKKSGVYLSVLGFGTDNLKDNKLESIADYGNGNYSYIDSVYEAKRVLVNEMGATLNTVAKDVKLQAHFNDGMVEEYRLIGYENRTMAAEDFADDTVDGGEIGAGHRVTALYEVKLTDKGAESLNDIGRTDMSDTTGNLMVCSDTDEDFSENALLSLGIRYKEPTEDESKLLTYELTGESYRKNSSDNMKFAAAVAGFGMILRESDYKGTLTDDMVIALASSTDYEGDKLKEEFIELVELHKDGYEVTRNVDIE